MGQAPLHMRFYPAGKIIITMLILDTSILMEVGKVDVFGQLKEFQEFGEHVVLSSCLDELERLGTKKSRFAKLLVEKLHEYDPKLKIVKSFERNADKAILKYARPGKDAVVTNDKKLIKELKLNIVKVIRLRQKKYLEFA
jgi:rRNA-processing protein FCF1